MFLEKNFLEKKNSGQYIVGYDLGDEFSQISYWKMGENGPETASGVMGEEQFQIPTILCKRKDVNQWFYGKEAKLVSEEKEGTLLTNLVSLARAGEMVQLEEEEFHPEAILALFMKRSLSLIHMQVPLHKIAAFMVTTESMDLQMVEILRRLLPGLGLKTDKIFFQSHMESFYYYMLYQDKALWSQDVLLFDYGEEYMQVHRLVCNPRTTPIVAYIDTVKYPELKKVKLPEEEELQGEMQELLDNQFAQIAVKACKVGDISSVFLIGEGFKGNWLKKSLEPLCKNRRVFQGSNLYSKGACYSAMEKLSQSDTGKQYFFLGREKLKANIGMKVYRRGEESYLALLDAGVNWFETGKTCEIYLDREPRVILQITPLNGAGIWEHSILLEGLPERPARATRLSLKLHMVSETRIHIEIADKGFGELFAATDKVWTDEFEI